MIQHPSPERILQTGLAFWASKTLLSAIEMGVFTELARGPERFDALSGRLGLHPRSARDFLDTLVALGFLQRTGDAYANTPETDLFLDRKKPSYVGRHPRDGEPSPVSRSGAISPRRCAPGSRRTRSSPAARASSRRSTPIRRG